MNFTSVRRSLRWSALAACGTLAVAVAAQTPVATRTPVPPPPAYPEGVTPWRGEDAKDTAAIPVIDVPDGQLPNYGDLRLQTGKEQELELRFSETLPLLRGELFTTDTIFAAPAESPYRELVLQDLIAIALRENLQLKGNDLGVEIARSSVRSEEATFIPFIDLVGNARTSTTRRHGVEVADPSATPTINPDGTVEPAPPKEVIVKDRTDTVSGGAEAGVTLPTGGSITSSVTSSRTNNISNASGDRLEEAGYQNRAEIRFLQPLLRGGGFEVGTAALRSARLSEMDTRLGEQILERDTVLRVITTYFQIAATKQQLQVSADAIRERKRFLEETRLKYDVGRVAESEILRAEIQYLQELETAISRRQQLDNAKEDLLLLLGLPLETELSLLDVTPSLLERGRFAIPEVQTAIEEAKAGRPELMRRDISLARAEISLRVDRNQLLPQLDFDAGYNRSDAGDDWDAAEEMEDSGWDAGLTLRVPLINIQRREAARRSALSVEQQRIERVSAERGIVQEVINAHRAVLSTEATLTILQKTVEQARKNLELINGSFEVGFSSVTEVRLAQDDLFAAEVRYRSALLNYQSSIARLYVAMGRPLY